MPGESLVEELGEALRLIGRLRDEIARKDEALIALSERIGELEKQLGEQQRGSKRQAAPFSKGNPKATPKRSGRKSGDDHGVHGHRRVPVGPPDRDLDAGLPSCCPDCGGRVIHERTVEQWQVDVPEPRVVTTRFRVGVGRCEGCKRRVQGAHPEQTSQALGAAGSGVGPRVKAWGAWLHYGLGLSFARSRQVLAAMGVNVTAGAITQAAERSASRELAALYEDLVKVANQSPSITMDESGWRVGGHNAWLWVGANTQVTLGWIAPARDFASATQVIDAGYDGVLVRDGYVVYDQYSAATHQSCLAHLLRRCNDLEGVLTGTDRRTPRAVKKVLKEALAARDLPSHAERAGKATDLRAQLDRLCARPQANDENRKLLKHLTGQADALFSFLTHEDVPATNYLGEQAVRPCVVNRKTWGGNRTWNGAHTQTVLTSVIATATKHGHNIVDYLTDRARGPDPNLTHLLT